MINRHEKHRLTVLQKQLMYWLKNEGGGCLRADQLFTSMVQNHRSPDADSALLAERMYEAVENLCKMEYAEIRLESDPKSRKKLSLFDLGSPGKNFKGDHKKYHWVGKECPSIALTNGGLNYADTL
ncbi:MAG TPA: hypothetical protein VL651_00485 [Bacteroidia bacterium]|jgi:hypothetical protein|nr:hypothetical protein [Bacteroidia bacterium]